MRKISLAVAVSLAGLASCGGSPSDTGEVASEVHGVGDKKPVERVKIAAVVRQTNLVASNPGQDAVVDPDLVNPWGLAFSANGVAWVAINANGVAGLYNSDGIAQAKITIPPPRKGQPPSAPTGVAFNADSATHQGDIFVFATEDGTIVGWQPQFDTTGVVRVDRFRTGAIYKGIALATPHGKPRVYAADFHHGRIDVFDDAYMPVLLRWGAFVDRAIPRGFAPFNVLAHDGQLFVSYAKQDRKGEDDVPGPGNGFIDVFDLDGNFQTRLVSDGALNSPWGMAFAPSAPKGKQTLLVGNFGDGRINVYEIERDRYGGLDADFEGALGDSPHHALVLRGLWAIVFGPGVAGFGADQLFFTAGPEHESAGLFGRLDFLR